MSVNQHLCTSYVCGQLVGRDPGLDVIGPADQLPAFGQEHLIGSEQLDLIDEVNTKNHME